MLGVGSQLWLGLGQINIRARVKARVKFRVRVRFRVTEGGRHLHPRLADIPFSLVLCVRLVLVLLSGVMPSCISQEPASPATSTQMEF